MIEESYTLMEEAVSLNKGLEHIFKMNEESLGVFCDYDFKEVDKRVTQDLKKSASLIEKFDVLSQRSRKIFESLNYDFTSEST